MSVRENEYSKITGKKTDEELVLILKEHDKYIDDLLWATIWEMQLRNIHEPLMDTLPMQLKASEPVEETPAEIVTEAAEGTPEKTETTILPPLFSQTAIMAFALFLTPLFGGVLLAINVAKVYKKAVLPVIFFSIVYTLITGYTIIKTQGETGLTYLNIILRIVGAVLLSEVLWNKYIGRQVKYEKRSLKIPLIIALLIFIPACYLFWKHPELFPYQKK